MPSCAYFPAASLSQCERLELNFGARPFAHPVSLPNELLCPALLCELLAGLKGQYQGIEQIPGVSAAPCSTGKLPLLNAPLSSRSVSCADTGSNLQMH